MQRSAQASKYTIPKITFLAMDLFPFPFPKRHLVTLITQREKNIFTLSEINNQKIVSKGHRHFILT